MKILVVAGEASADIHAGHLISRLKESVPVELIGVGGDHLQAHGLKPLKTAREMAVVGFSEVIKRIPSTLRLITDLESLAAKEKPDLALLLDLPDFNLRLAPRLKKLGIPIVYYISPQVWAWRSKRVNAMARDLDLLLSILPFEKPWYEANSPSKLPVKYVGHPVLEEVPDLAYAPMENQIALLPGSREGEMERLFPILISAAALLKEKNAALQFVLPLAETLRHSSSARAFLAKDGPCKLALVSLGESFQVVERPAHEVLRQSKLALVASGTATLETGIVGTPMVVLYKVSPSTAFIFRYFVKYQGAIAMVNLVHAGLGSAERVVPELLQEAVTPKNIADTAFELLSNEDRWMKMRDRLAQTRAILQGPGLPTKNAADAILEFFKSRCLT